MTFTGFESMKAHLQTAAGGTAKVEVGHFAKAKVSD